MRIILNGEKHELEREGTVAELLEQLETPAAGTAVAVNSAIVPRDDYASTMIRHDDRVEVIRAIGGG